VVVDGVDDAAVDMAVVVEMVDCCVGSTAPAARIRTIFDISAILTALKQKENGKIKRNVRKPKLTALAARIRTIFNISAILAALKHKRMVK
jgi:putative N-acetylmannosamine-6-phosphate epimerase